MDSAMSEGTSSSCPEAWTPLILLERRLSLRPLLHVCCTPEGVEPRTLIKSLRILVMALAIFVMIITEAAGQMSISTLRASVESANLELVTLQGTVQLTRPSQQQLGGTCGGRAFTLVDDSGSIEVTVRRAGRLLLPLRDGDRVQVTAQVHVFRNSAQVPLLICVDTTEIQPLHN